MDRNSDEMSSKEIFWASLSARRAWIEIQAEHQSDGRNESLSARRAWIEMLRVVRGHNIKSVALRKESLDRNMGVGTTRDRRGGRSPQGERG